MIRLIINRERLNIKEYIREKEVEQSTNYPRIVVDIHRLLIQLLGHTTHSPQSYT